MLSMMRGAALFLAALTAVACGSPGAPDPYLTDAHYRRAELVASLVNPANGYSSLRLAHYDTGTTGDWSSLPEWNPPTEPLTEAVLDSGHAGDRLGTSATALVIDDAARSGSEESLLAVGEAAFSRYPVQLADPATTVLHTTADAATYGLWADPSLGVGGLVRVRLADGSTTLAETCATCHSLLRDGALVAGAPNPDLDWGALLVAATKALDPAVAANLLAWGPGRLDVTTTSGTEPVRIADLRPVRWLGYLQADATVQQRDVTSLAIRIETLVITSHQETLRPPREVSLGLAYYVRSLADSLPTGTPETSAATRGAATFGVECASCHVPPALTGAPVPLDVVGTDPTLGLSADRGTGTYRVPSLHGVAARGPLFHDGRAPDLAAVLDPDRVSPGYTGALHGTGPIPGHPFGLGLSSDARADLLAYLGGS